LAEAIEPASVRAQLDRLLKSPQLEASPSLCRFLRFVVEETLAGRGGSLKEYSLGTGVFDRGEAFDPRMDPIVRVQARNLRARLAQYYDGPGATDPVQIDLPKRTYVPVFQARIQSAIMAAPAEAAGPVPIVSEPTVSEPIVPQPIVPQRHTRRALTAGAVVGALVLTGGALWWSQRPQHTARIHEPDPQAQHLYIRGRYLMDRQTEQGLRDGIAAFDQAIARDPRFAAAYAGLADGYNILAQYGYIPPAEGMEKARKAAERALDIEPGLAEGHVSLAAVLEAYDWNWKGAEREYKRALALNPYLPSAHLWYGMFLRDQGRIDEALPQLRRAAQLDPFSVITSVNLAHGLMVSGNHAAAMEQALRATEISPEAVTAHVILANAHRAQSRTGDAEAALDRALPYTEGNPHGLALLARAYARSGRKEESRKLLAALEQLAQTRYVSPFDMGTVSLALGDEERALTMLQEAFRQRSSGLIFLRDAKFTRLQRAPEFHSLIEKMHFAG
jgi:tetratricopeptide (TPR) repeat protein